MTSRRVHHGLETLISPISLEQFLEQHWPSNHLVVHGAPERLADLMTAPPLQSVEQLLNVHKGLIMAQFYDHAGTEWQMRCTPQQALALYNGVGMTLCVRDVDRIDEIKRWQQAIERDLGVPPGLVKCNIYASPPGSGLTKHYDNHAVFVAQIRGTKQWQYAPNPEQRFPLTGWGPAQDDDPEAARLMPDNTESFTMKPGSVVFVCPGDYHKTTTTEPSLSISLGVWAPRLADIVLAGVRKQLLGQERWRERVIQCWGGPDQRKPAIERLASVLAELDRDLTLDAAELVRDYRDPATAKALKTAEYRGRKVFRRNPLAEALWRELPGGHAFVLRVEVKGREPVELEIDGSVKPLCDWMVASDEPFSVKDAAAAANGIGGGQLEALIERLVEAGALHA